MTEHTSGYYRDEFGRLASLYDFGVKNAFRWIGGEIGFRCGIVEAADVRPGQHVLDVACGTGTLLALLAACTGPDGRAVGIDMSEQMLEMGRQKVKMSQVEFIQGNAEALPFEDESFDRATASLAIHEMNRQGRANALAEMHRVLKPGGLAVLADMRRPDTLPTKLGMRFVRMFETDTLTDMWSHGLYREVMEAGFWGVTRHIAGRGFFEVLVGEK
ncbi:MAG: class I SAM-dependent methyltransferase [Actinobacteria bacterium]|nr:class I SAM-dependent methyltransferase [Actinomycetota bacterium]